MRLIDADKIIYTWIVDADGEEHDGVTLQSIIHKTPTIDAVSVVRCKDCKYSYESLNYRICSHGVCVDCVVTNDFYCGCGAKMDEEDQKMPDVQKYIELMKDAVETSRENEEKGHNMADGILCDFLTELGYEALVKEWEKVYKWYS